jgi:hypothetical protein
MFPSRLLDLAADEMAAGPTFDPQRINQHIEGRVNGQRIMSDAEIESLLNDPFALLVLRRGRFPTNLTELLAALDEHNDSSHGLPDTTSFLVSEGGQIPFQPGVGKGGSRLLIVRTRRDRSTGADLMISVLTPPDTSPRSSTLLLEVLAWDPVNRTFHFYQRQQGAWFWCGQSDMAFDDDARGHGPFDSHINGYPNMKELKFPWVHWHGPTLAISENAYAPDDPLVSDPLFLDRSPANLFEDLIMVLVDRWNEARFDKAVAGHPTMSPTNTWLRQVVDSTSFGLISSGVRFATLPDRDLNDVPATFFVDQDCLIDGAGAALPVRPPALRLSGSRYAGLVQKYDLRLRGRGIDIQGDVPFCFTVPERAREDVVVVRLLIAKGVMSRRLAACLLMVDFANPMFSATRASLLRHLPDGSRLEAGASLDEVLVERITRAASASPPGSAERQFVQNWELGPSDWPTTFADRIDRYLEAVASRLQTDDGSD